MILPKAISFNGLSISYAASVGESADSQVTPRSVEYSILDTPALGLFLAHAIATTLLFP